MRLKDLNCVVTGGSSGIGAASVERFVSEGANVLIADIDIDSAFSFADEMGPTVKAIKCDVRIEEDVKAVADYAYSLWNKVDVLVNNAGSELNQTYDKTTLEEWDRVLDTDLKGPWLMCKHIVPGMVKAGSGSVINISSLNGLVGFPLSTAYGSAKGGLVVFTRDMAIESVSYTHLRAHET